MKRCAPWLCSSMAAPEARITTATGICRLNSRKQLPSGPIEPNESDSPLFGPFEILIQGLDGGWASIEPQWHPRFSSFLHPWFVTLIGAVILVPVLSAFTATRSLKSLHRLVEAAEKLGRTREATAIDAAGTSSGSLPMR